MENTIKYMTRDGKTEITLTVEEQYNEVIVKTIVGGKCVGSESWARLIKQGPCGLPDGTVASVGKVALTAERLAEVAVLAAPIQSAIDARPEMILRRKVEAREDLVRERGYAVEAHAAAHERMIEQLSATGVSRISLTDLAAAESKAQSAVEAFDAENPDVVSEVSRLRSERVDEFVRNGN